MLHQGTPSHTFSVKRENFAVTVVENNKFAVFFNEDAEDLPSCPTILPDNQEIAAQIVAENCENWQHQNFDATEEIEQIADNTGYDTAILFERRSAFGYNLSRMEDIPSFDAAVVNYINDNLEFIVDDAAGFGVTNVLELAKHCADYFDRSAGANGENQLNEEEVPHFFNTARQLLETGYVPHAGGLNKTDEEIENLIGQFK